MTDAQRQLLTEVTTSMAESGAPLDTPMALSDCYAGIMEEVRPWLNGDHTLGELAILARGVVH